MIKKSTFVLLYKANLCHVRDNLFSILLDKRFLIDPESIDLNSKYAVHVYTTAEGDMCNVLLDMDDTYTSQSPTEITDANHEDWIDASTKLLLSTFEEKRDLLKQCKIKTKKLMYIAISEALQMKGYSFTAAQVSNKWKTLERALKIKWTIIPSPVEAAKLVRLRRKYYSKNYIISTKMI